MKGSDVVQKAGFTASLSNINGYMHSIISLHSRVGLLANLDLWQLNAALCMPSEAHKPLHHHACSLRRIDCFLAAVILSP